MKQDGRHETYERQLNSLGFTAAISGPPTSAAERDPCGAARKGCRLQAADNRVCLHTHGGPQQSPGRPSLLT